MRLCEDFNRINVQLNSLVNDLLSLGFKYGTSKRFLLCLYAICVEIFE